MNDISVIFTLNMEIFKTHLVFLSILTCLEAVRRHLQENEVARAVQMIEDGLTQRQVAVCLGVSRSVVSRLWNRYQQTRSYSRCPRQGRHRGTTPRQDRYINQCALRDRFASARSIQSDLQHATGVRFSTQVIRNRLHETNLRSRRPV